MNPVYKMWFSFRESEEAKTVSLELLQGAYGKIKKDWILGDIGYSPNMTPAEFYSRPSGGFLMVIKEDPGSRERKYRLAREACPATHMEFVAHSQEVLETMILEEAGLPFDRTRVQIVDREAGKISRLPVSV